MTEPQFLTPVNARWDPKVRHDVAMKRIRLAVEKALGHSEVEFTREDLAYVAELMGFRLKARRTTDELAPTAE